MMLFSRKYQLSADIDHVIRCFTDLEAVAEASSFIDKEARVRPKVKNDGLYLVAEEPMMKITRFTEKSNGIYSARVTLIPGPLNRLGDMVVKCSFSATHSGTSVVATLEAEKTPKLLWRFFVKFIILVLVFQSRAEEKRYIQWVEESA